MTHQIDHDNALGEDEDFSDRQGVFNTAGGSKPAVAPERSTGGGAAKLFLLIFGVAMLGIVLWFGWKILNRGSTEAADTLSLPADDAAGVPMTGAPAEMAPLDPVEPQPTAGVDTDEPSAAMATAPSSVEVQVPGPAATAVSPAAPTGVQAVPSQIAPGGAPIPGAAPASSDGTQGAAAEPSANEPKTEVVAAAELAQLRKELSANAARIADLEREVGRLRAGQNPAPALTRRPSAPSRPNNGARRPTSAVTASTSTKPKPAPVAQAATAPANVVLKAVLDGRAWLQLKNGETVTVAPGDDVAGSTVTAIDAERGTVRLSNGAVLR